MVHMKSRKITRKDHKKKFIKKTKQKRNKIQERCVCTKNCDSDIHLPGPYQIVLQLKHQSKTKRKQSKRGSSNAQALWFGFWSSYSSSSVRSSANLCVIFVLHAFSSFVCFFHFIYQSPPPLPHRFHALILALLALKTIIQPSGNGTNLLTRNKRWPKFCFHTIFPGHGWRRMVAQVSEHVAHAWLKQSKSQWKTLPHCHISSGC